MDDSEVVVLARSRRRRPGCPTCNGCRVTVHSYYARTLRDLPCWGRPGPLIVRLLRFLRCREARYERYRAVVALAERGVSQREIAATVHVQPLTVSRWVTAGEFPERQVSSIRRRDERRLLRDVAIGRPTTKRSFSAGRVAALLVKPPGLLAEAQRS